MHTTSSGGKGYYTQAAAKKGNTHPISASNRQLHTIPDSVLCFYHFLKVSGNCSGVASGVFFNKIDKYLFSKRNLNLAL
jgi:hypothetical protein